MPSDRSPPCRSTIRTACRTFSVDVPELRPRDVLVRVAGDVGQPRRRQATCGAVRRRTEPKILGYDASGVVEAAGAEVSTLSVGDEVWYAGDIRRQGTNAEFHAVDERIAARKPKSLSSPTGRGAAADHDHRLGDAVRPVRPHRIVAGRPAGARGRRRRRIDDHPACQGAHRGARDRDGQPRRLPASGPPTLAPTPSSTITTWPRRPARLRQAASTTCSPRTPGDNVDPYAQIMRPFGHITAIDEPPGLDLVAAEGEEHRLALGADVHPQPLRDARHDRAAEASPTRTAELVDAGTLRTTMTQAIGAFNATGLREAHRAVESGRMIGKVVVHR